MYSYNNLGKPQIANLLIEKGYAKTIKEAIEKLGAKGIVEIDNQLKIIFGPNAKELKRYIDDIV